MGRGGKESFFADKSTLRETSLQGIAVGFFLFVLATNILLANPKE